MVDEIMPEDLHERLEDGDAPQIIDIRSSSQYAEGHLPGALNIPMHKLPSRIKEVEWENDVVVACPIGQSSVQAARLINSFEEIEDSGDVRSMAGGYDAWEYELEREDDT